MNKTRFFGGLSLLILCFCLISCAMEEPDYLSYTEKSFRAEVEGRLYETDFSARIEVARQNDAESGAVCQRISVTYLSPAELEGITVTVLRDTQTGEEEITASLGEISLAVSRKSVEGWLLPAESLLSVSREEIESLQKNQTGYCLVFSMGKIITVDERGLPISLESQEISFSVTQIQPFE